MAIHLLAAAVAALAMRYKSGMPQARPSAPAFAASHPDRLELQFSPIKPEWVMAGEPVARLASHFDAEDGCAATGIWDCTEGTFRWFFKWDETVVILEGEVHVTADDGTERILRAGDIAYFRSGSWATWHVADYVRKIAFLRKPMPAPVVALSRLKTALRTGYKRLSA